ncbi:MAG: Trm112 family protein [Hyphomicrobiaceae bacterium]|nr:Trm112 family protein [Hyphomicrobiaceae bacterium]
MIEPPTARSGHEEPHQQGARKIDPKLLELLVCPVTKTSLEYDAERQELVSRAARLAYPIRDGMPIMLPEEARTLEEDEPRRR